MTLATLVLGVDAAGKFSCELRALTSGHREVLESLRSMVNRQVGLLSVTPAKECKGLEARIFLQDDISTVGLPLGHFESQGFRQHYIILG